MNVYNNACVIYKYCHFVYASFCLICVTEFDIYHIYIYVYKCMSAMLAVFILKKTEAGNIKRPPRLI